MTRRFRYALEPVLMTRQWDLNNLLVELGEKNEALAEEQNKLVNLQENVNTAYQDWRKLEGQQQGLSVEQLTMYSRFVADLLAQVAVMQSTIAELTTQRDELIDKVVAAQKAVEAFEQHRDEMKEKFMQLRLSGDFKIADDQWNTILAGVEANDT